VSDVPIVPSLDLTPSEPPESIRSRPPHWRWYYIVLTGVGMFVAQIIALMASLMVAASERGVSVEALQTLSDEQVLELSMQPMSVLISVTVQEALMLTAIGLLAMLPARASFRAMGYRPTTIQWVLIGAGVAIPLIFIRLGVATAVIEVLDIDISNLERVGQMLTSGDTPQSIILLVILVSVVVPFVEELFFRGMVFKWLR
jgi:membrane protease YdiL (CAAX protease family)